MKALSDKFGSVEVPTDNDGRPAAAVVYDNFMAPCRAHAIATTKGAALATMSVMRLLKLTAAGTDRRAIGAATGNAAVVIAWSTVIATAATIGFCHLFSSWDPYGAANVVLGGSVALLDAATLFPVAAFVAGTLLVFNALVCAIFVKQHRLSTIDDRMTNTVPSLETTVRA